MSLETMTKLATTTVGVGTSASVTFSNIPQGYTDLKVVMSTRGAENYKYASYTISFNGSSTSFTGKELYAVGPNSGSANRTTTFYNMNGSPSTTNAFSNIEVYVPNYASNNYKTFNVDGASEDNAVLLNNIAIGAGLWSNSSPITSITFAGGGGNFVQYSTFTLYGIKNAQKTAGNSIKATGGNIVFDGTYVYHVFPSTGAFVPTSSLTADVLVVAGGGGGGGGGTNYGGGGGGGAGGLLGFANQSFSNGITYSCAVGAGGAGGTGSSVGTTGTVGTDSQFGALTTVKGGGYGATYLSPYTGGTGGSGGGGSYNGAGGSPTSGQGNAGSAGTSGGSYWGGSGGGAATAATAASGGTAAVAGVGLSTYSAWGVLRKLEKLVMEKFS